MHVYTPPGYELGEGKFPVLYLLHGGGDSDNSWTSIGRAGVILDNMIAAKTVTPMVVVMPAGHTGASGFGMRGAAPAGGTPGQAPADEFTQDFMTDIMPCIDKFIFFVMMLIQNNKFKICRAYVVLFSRYSVN